MRVLALCGRVGRAGLPGALWCASPFPLAALSLCFAWPPPGWGCPPLSRCPCRSSLPWRCALVVFPRPPAAWLFVRSRLVCVSRLAVGCSLVVSPAPLPFCVSRFSSLLLGALVFFFSFFFLPLLPLCAPVVSGCLLFPAPGALDLGAVRCLLCWPSASRLSVRLSLFRAFRLAAGCSPVVAAPPPPFCPPVFVAAARCCVPCAVLCCAFLGPVLRRAAARCVLRCCAVPCCVVLVGCRCLLRRALWRCPLPWGPVLCGAAICGVPPCCVCFVVARWCVLLFAALLCAVCVPGCCAVRSVSSPLCAVLCFAVLVRSRCAVCVVRAVAGAWCCGVPWCGAGSGGPWLSAGGVFRCRCPTCCGRGRAGVGPFSVPWAGTPCGGCAPRSCAGGRAGGGGRAPYPPFVRLGGGAVGRGVALPHSVPLPSLGRQQSGCHWRCAVHGGRGPPYHSRSCSPGFSGCDLCGVPARWRGLACSSRPPWEPAAGAGGRVALRLLSPAGGGPSPLPRGVGAGAPAACGPVGGRGGRGVAPRPPCSPSGRRPAVLNPGPPRVVGALPSGVRVRSGSKCRPGVGGV